MHLAIVNEPAVFAVDDRGVAERRFFEHDESDRLSGIVTWRGLVEVAAELRRREDAVGLFVDDDFHHDPLARADFAGLFAEGEEEIFGEPPVEEGTDTGVDLDDIESGEVTDLAVRQLGRRDDAVLGVARDKNGDLVTLLDVGRDLPRRQQDLAERSAVEIETVVRFTNDEEGIDSAKEGHPAE